MVKYQFRRERKRNRGGRKEMCGKLRYVITEPEKFVISYILCDGDRKTRELFVVGGPRRGVIGRDRRCTCVVQLSGFLVPDKVWKKGKVL